MNEVWLVVDGRGRIVRRTFSADSAIALKWKRLDARACTVREATPAERNEFARQDAEARLTVECDWCNGDARDEGRACGKCNGTGRMEPWLAARLIECDDCFRTDGTHNEAIEH